MPEGSVRLTLGAEPVEPTAPAVDTTVDENGTVKLRAAETPATPPTAERPSWLPQKFATAEDMAKSYNELETKLGQPKPEAPKKAAPAKASTDFASITKEYSETGELTAASAAALEAAGLSLEDVNTFVEGQKAVAARITNTVSEALGGADKLEATLEWARTNLEAEQAEAFDSAVRSGNVAMIKLAARGVAEAYAEANGSDPALVTGETVPRSSDDPPFTSSYLMVEAMKDVRYEKDAAYRAMIERRLAKSDLFGY